MALLQPESRITYCMSDENQDPRIHPGVLAGHHDHNSHSSALSDSSVHVSGNGRDAFFNGSDALNLSPVQILEALVQQKQEQKDPNGPEIGPAFSSIFIFIVILVLLKTWHLSNVYITVVSFGTAFALAVMKILVLLQWEGSSKTHVEHPQKTLRFFGWFGVSRQRQRFFSTTSTCGPYLQ